VGNVDTTGTHLCLGYATRVLKAVLAIGVGCVITNGSAHLSRLVRGNIRPVHAKAIGDSGVADDKVETLTGERIDEIEPITAVAPFVHGVVVVTAVVDSFLSSAGSIGTKSAINVVVVAVVVIVVSSRGRGRSCRCGSSVFFCTTASPPLLLLLLSFSALEFATFRLSPFKSTHSFLFSRFVDQVERGEDVCATIATSV
jgi:hypothetical protein